jgi:hypothetical protein
MFDDLDDTVATFFEAADKFIAKEKEKQHVSSN